MTAIQNHDAYCGALHPSLGQKMFFWQHLPKLGLVLDYGCADGALVTKMRRQYENVPFADLICLDTDEAMLAKCPKEWKMFHHSNETEAFKLFTSLRKSEKHSAMIFSSVLHELYSQNSAEEMESLWARVAATEVDYIVVRDMYWGEQGNSMLSEYPTPYCQFIKWLGKHCNRGQSQQLKDYNDYLPCGESTNDAKHAVEFLLKMPYNSNWERELLEEYFSVPDLRPILAELGYEVQLWEHHQVDFIQERIKTDMGIDLPFNTHIKAIFKRSS